MLGTRLGPYEVLSLIGSGGMGDVYVARDTRLDRRVAVKVLAPELAADPVFRDRFTREARAISLLDHPHICRLFDVGHQDETRYLVLELIEGETLSARLERGRLPIREVLRFAVQIAAALEAAHAQGIIHRDLKPGNVMLTAAGVKLVDFGLAKTIPGLAEPSALKTAPPTATAEGTFIGTLQYMAPEQIQGHKLDARTDIFALGAVVYEMATGRRAFAGETQASVIARILEVDPPAVSSLSPQAPPDLDPLVQGCLAKSAADRWQTAHDVRMQLQWIETQVSRAYLSAQAPRGLPRRGVGWIPWAIATVTVVLSAAVQLWPRPDAEAPSRVRFDLVVPAHMWQLDYNHGAISPDGERFIFEATVDGRAQLVLRDMSTGELVVLAGTELAFSPFWSPDSRAVAFFHPDGHLKTISLAGGRSRTITGIKYSASVDLSGAWGRGLVVFAPGDGRIYRVPEAGGEAVPIDMRPEDGKAKAFGAPRFLPDGQLLVAGLDVPGVYVASLDSRQARRILEDGGPATFAAGHLFYSRGTSLFARSFDPRRLAFSGAELQVTERASYVSVSNDGTVVYRPTGPLPSTLTWFDRAGRRGGKVGDPGPYDQLVLSPRGRRATVVRLEADGNSDLWDVDLASGIFSRLTTHPAIDTDPSWAPDERTLAFTSFRGGRAAIFKKDLTSGKEDQFVALDEDIALDQWTPDGRFIMFRTFGKSVYMMPLTGEQRPRLLSDTPYVEDEVHVSPNSRWVAFDANESGRWEVYVAAFPEFTSKRQVSSNGGTQPQWRGDGRELFYIGLDGSMMSVRVGLEREFTASAPSVLFPSRIAPNPSVPQYAVLADGQRFLALERLGAGSGFTFLINSLNTRSAAGH